MAFKPVKQLNTILTREYFEPTVSWAFRVVVALNVPLIVLPLFTGFSYKIIWAAFGAYMLALLDYRGLHYKKVVIQLTEAFLMFVAAIAGMLVTSSLLYSVIAMFIVGMFAALIRNWRDYGASIGVAIGFFFLFGLASPKSLEEALPYGYYLLIGAGWSVLITLVSFPFHPSSPLRRSVAKIWKTNTDFLDILIRQTAGEKIDPNEITQKEIEVRKVIDQSIDLFSRGIKQKAPRESHYDAMMELRRISALFGAVLGTLHEESEVMQGAAFVPVKDAGLYKTLSALGQASARMAIVIYTFRPDDLTMVKIRVKRYEIAMDVFKQVCNGLQLNEKERKALDHFMDTLHKACLYLQQSVEQIEKKLNIDKGEYFENYRLSFNNFIAGLNSQALFDFLRNLANISTDQFRYALRVSIGLCIGVFAYKFFKIDHGYWIPLTMIIVIQPYYGATRKKGFERVLGTLAGIAVGGVIMLFPLSHEAFVILLAIVSFFVAYFLRNNYKVGVFFVTVMMVIMMQLSQQASWELIGWRILSTLIGAALAMVAGFAFWPVWEKQRFPVLISEALEQVKNYLTQVLRFYNRELPAGETWYKYRRMAEAANSMAFASVQRMYEEPQHAQDKVDVSFAMVGVSIRLTREITAIALLIHDNTKNEKIPALTEFSRRASVLLDGFVDCIRLGKCEYPDLAPIRTSLDDPAFASGGQLPLIRTELEKIIFELETISRLNTESWN